MYAYRRFGYGIGIGPPGTLGTQLPPPEYPLQEFPGSIVRAPFAGFKSYFGGFGFVPSDFCGLPKVGADESARVIAKIRQERIERSVSLPSNQFSITAAKACRLSRRPTLGLKWLL